MTAAGNPVEAGAAGAPVEAGAAGAPVEAGVLRRFAVDGMHCASCVRRVEEALNHEPGVRGASVNLASAEARVWTDAADSDPQRLVSALQAAGYELTPIAEGAPSQVRQRLESEARTLRTAWLQCAAWTLPIFVLSMSGIDSPASRWLQAALCIPVVFVHGMRFHTSAWARARHGAADMDTLVSLGTLSAFGLSAVSLTTGAPLYFEGAAVITTLVLLGRHFEGRARWRAAGALSRLSDLAAGDAVRLRGDATERVPVELLQPGDRIEIAAGARVPADAEVVEGVSAVDTSLLTGEPLPVDVSPGAPLFGGTVNGRGRLLAVVTRTGDDSALARVRRAVEEAQASKAPIERVVDRVAGIFVPAVLGLAFITALGWLVAGAALPTALTHAVAVLVIACPCALGLATPTAVMVGSGRGAELGVLFRDAEVFERARNVDTVLFDKTGTLTRGELRLERVEAGAGDPAAMLARAAAVERASGHPIGDAIVAAAHERNVVLPEAIDVETIPGCGVRGVVMGGEVRVGRIDWLEDMGWSVAPALASAANAAHADGLTAFAVGWEGEIRGILCVADTLRDEAPAAVDQLKALGANLGIVSGDAEAPVRAVARRLGIDRIFAGLLPEQKAAVVAAEQADGRVVAFVGDGINDAPALSQADLGLAVAGHGGAAIAADAGDVVLVQGGPARAVIALALARRTFSTIRQNLVWAFAYNVAALPLAAFGVLDPMIAAGAMAGSSFSVVANSLRLRRFSAESGDAS